MTRATVTGVFCLLVACSACATSATTRSGAAEADPPAEIRPCRISVSEDAAGVWQEVRATGFTFCVPANWRPVGGSPAGDHDATTWRGDGGSISWRVGEYRPRPIRTEIATVRVGDPLPAASPGEIRHFDEVIGGRRATLWDNQFEGEYYTGAKWVSPAIYLEGETRSRGSARLQLDVYRTVRFTAQ